MIAITNGPVTNVAGMVPTGGTVTQITSGGGQIFFGPGQFVNTGFTTLNAKGANVTFFRDVAAVDGVNAIQLNSNFIFADPPVPGVVLLPGAVQAAPFLHTGVGGVVPGALNIDSNSQANMVAPTTNVIVPAALLAPTDSTMPSTRVLWSGAGVHYDEISSPGTAANAAAATASGSAAVRFTAGPVGSITGRSVASSAGASPACSVVDSGPGCSDSGDKHPMVRWAKESRPVPCCRLVCSTVY